jgi:hypothetical protein
VLQYHIRLAASGMRDGLLSGVSTAERMAALETYNRALRKLAWSAHDKIDIPASGMPQVLDGLIVSFSEDRRALTIHQLPSKLRTLEARQWTLAFEFAIAGFTIDASQDLLALVPLCATPSPTQWHVFSPTFRPRRLHETRFYSRCEPRILLRTLSTGQQHPLADPSSCAAIELQDGKLQPTMDGDTTAIYGAYLGTVVHGGPLDQLVIWNWTTCEQVWCMPMDKGVTQWCFLDDAHIVFPKSVAVDRRARSRRLHVRRFRRNTSGPVQGSATDDTGGAAECVLELPDVRYPRGSASMGTRLLSRPKPNPAAHASVTSLPTTKTLFYPSAEDHLLTVELWAYSSESGWEASNLHIPTRDLLQLLQSPPLTPQSQRHQNEQTSATGPTKDKANTTEPRPNVVVVPWEEWSHRRFSLAQSAPLDRPRDMAPLGPLSYGMRRIAWDCGIQSQYGGNRENGAATATAAAAAAATRKVISVCDLHPGRIAQALRGGRDCGVGSGPAEQQQPYIHSEVLLPREIQEADPVGLKFLMCGDALVVFEVRLADLIVVLYASPDCVTRLSSWRTRQIDYTCSRSKICCPFALDSHYSLKIAVRQSLMYHSCPATFVHAAAIVLPEQQHAATRQTEHHGTGEHRECWVNHEQYAPRHRRNHPASIS